jgi:hypothetical protein
MPQLSAQIEQRLNDLLRTAPTGDTLLGKLFEDRSKLQGWGISAMSLISSVVQDARHPYRNSIVLLGLNLPSYGGDTVVKLRGMLEQLRADFAAGLLTNLESQISAQTFEDLLVHAGAYLHDGRKEPAGVLTGVVFEDTIHKLCARHGIPHAGLTLEPLLTALGSKNVLTALERKEGITAAGLRTSATHARWDEFDADQVESVLRFTRRLLQEKLGA